LYEILSKILKAYVHPIELFLSYFSKKEKTIGKKSIILDSIFFSENLLPLIEIKI
jgi:hypothetical protein